MESYYIIAGSSPLLAVALGVAEIGQNPSALVNGLNSNIATVGQPTVRLSGPSAAFSVGGFQLPGGATPAAGQQIAVINTTAQTMTVVNEDASSAAVARLTTQTGQNVILQPKAGTLNFVFDGTTLRWILQSAGVVQAKEYDVRDYGAAPSASAATNDAAFLSAVTAAANAGGGLVYAHGGTYNLNNTLALPVGVSLRGDGPGITVLSWGQANDCLDLHSGSTVAAHQFLKDFTITGNATALDGVSVTNRYLLRVEGVDVSNCVQRAFYHLGTYRCSMRDCFLGSNGSQATAKNITGATNANPTVIHAVAHGIANGRPVTIASVGGNTGANGNWTATLVDADHFSIQADTHLGSAYTSGGTAQDMGYAQIEIDGCTTWTWRDCHISGGNASTPSGFRVDRSNVVMLSGGSIESTGIAWQVAALYEASSTPYGITFDGVDFEGAGDHYGEAGYGWQGAAASGAVFGLRILGGQCATASNVYCYKFRATDSTFIDRHAMISASNCALWFEGSNNARQSVGVNGPKTGAVVYMKIGGSTVAAAGWGMPWSYVGSQPQAYDGYADGGMPQGSAVVSVSTPSGPVGAWTTNNSSPQNVTNILGAGGFAGQSLYIMNGDGGNTTLKNAAGGTGQMYLNGGVDVLLSGNSGVTLVTDGTGLNWVQM